MGYCRLFGVPVMAEDRKSYPVLDRHHLGWLRHVPAVASAVETTGSLLEQFGLKDWAFGIVAASVMGGAAWFWNHVPWWACVCLAVFLAYHIAGVVHRIQVIRAGSQFDPTKYRELGQSMVALSKEMATFFTDRHRDRMMSPQSADMHEQWQKDRDAEKLTAHLFHERFGPMTFSTLALLDRLGLNASQPVLWHMVSRPEIAPRFFGGVGQLLADGNLDAAIDLTKDRNFMWNISI